MSEPTSTPTGIKIEDCAECGVLHPVTRKHCKECGSPSLFAHSVHARRKARVGFYEHVVFPYEQRPASIGPDRVVIVTSFAEALAAARDAFTTAHGTEPVDTITSDRNGWVTIEAHGPRFKPAVRLAYQ